MQVPELYLIDCLGYYHTTCCSVSKERERGYGCVHAGSEQERTEGDEVVVGSAVGLG